ncbi:MAG TPA: site-2 protease family protein [Candidatus Limnocylindrales bacterium]
MFIENLFPKLLVVAILLLIAFPIHEAAHAWTAYRLGDATAKLFGRVSLNPIVHFDPLGALMLLISVGVGSGLVVGWAKPTPVNTANLRDRRNGEVLVALAGPVSNWLMALAGALVVRLLALPNDATSIPSLVAFYFVLFNIVLGIFNLLPVPPLDGSALLFRFLSPRQVWQIRPVLSQYGIFILLAVLIVAGPLLGHLIFSVALALLGW